MKRRNKLLICFFTLSSFNQVVLSNNLLSKTKSISNFEYNVKASKVDSNQFFVLNQLISNLLVNVNESQKSQVNKLSNFEILADKQTSFQDRFIAEGNVFINNNKALLRADKLDYDRKLKILNLEGSIRFKVDDQFITASEINYDFINGKGYLKDVYGTINLNTLGEVQFNNQKGQGNYSEDDLENNNINNVVANESGKVAFGRTKFNVDFSKIQKWRFKSDEIVIENNEWLSEKIIVTNDPFNQPQLIFNNYNVKIIQKEGETIFKSKWSSLEVDKKVKLPLGRRSISSKDNYFRWSLGYDKSTKDGVYINRNSDPIYFLNKKIKLNINNQLNIQRALTGKTNSFSQKNESVLAKKSKQDTKTLDFFGLDADLQSKIFGFDFTSNFSLNSFDLSKFKKIISNNSELSQVLNQEKTENSQKETEVAFFGNYREKIWNGSLGEKEILTAYGIKLEKNNFWQDHQTKKTSKVAAGYGYYESSARKDSSEIINSKRLNISLERSHSYPIWNPSIKKNISDEYKYIPNPINKGLNLNVQTKLDFFRYQDYYFQNLYTFKGGPELTLGNFKNKFFDYTLLSVYPKLTLARGESPFGFDQSTDNHAIEFNLEQQLLGPITLKSSTEYNLDINSNNYRNFYNTKYNINWNRRGYKVGIFYDAQSKSGGINFEINMFNFDGLGKKFN